VKTLMFTILAIFLASVAGVVHAGGPADNATGNVLGLVSGSWLHSFDFVADELEEPDYGKGFIRHVRLGNDEVTILREEFCPVVYAIVIGDEAWFSGPIIYDSNDPSPSRWMVVYAVDGGQPGGGNDLLLWDRVDNKDIALSYMDELKTASYKDYEIVDGDLIVFETAEGGNPEPPQFHINPGLNGTWYFSGTDGQGFMIDVFPDSQYMFLAWFTFDTELPSGAEKSILGDSSQRWLTAQGTYSGTTADLDIYSTIGGLFDTYPPVPEREVYGTLTVEFTDCSSGSVAYHIPSIGRHGVIPIERIVLENVPLCEALNK
jgi:hypothetical protein